jgi:hypothetical protein
VKYVYLVLARNDFIVAVFSTYERAVAYRDAHGSDWAIMKRTVED